MASTPTTRNRFNQQGTGDNTGTWGTVLNSQALALVDEALDGVSSLAVTGNVTLSSANYATDQSRRRILKLTGAPGATYTITVPSVEKTYFVHNATNAAQIIKAGGIGASVPASTLQWVYCDGTDCFAPSQTLNVAVGSIVDFGGATAPTGWLLCYGQAISRATYAALFGVLGTLWGGGDGSTTFNVPDLRGRATFGFDSMGGGAAGRTTTFLAGLGAVGGDQNPQIHNHGVTDPGHAHGVTDPGHNHPYTAFTNNGGTVVTPSGATTVQRSGSDYTNTTSNVVTGLSVNTAFTSISINNTFGGTGGNIPPAAVVNKIIYTGA